MALRQQVDHPLQVPSKANDDLATSPKADPLILLQSAFYNLYVACSSFLRALVWRTPSSSTLTGKGSDCRIAVNIVRITITLGISSDVRSRPGSVLRKNLFSIKSEHLWAFWEHTFHTPERRSNTTSLPWVFGFLFFSILLCDLFCWVYSVHGWVSFTNSLLKTNSVPQQMKLILKIFCRNDMK